MPQHSVVTKRFARLEMKKTTFHVRKHTYKFKLLFRRLPKVVSRTISYRERPAKPQCK